MLKIAYAKNYQHPLPVGHRFPMEKYSLLPEQLIYEGTINEENLFQPSKMIEDDILNVHQKSYWEKLKALNLTKSEERKTGFPLSKELVEREITIMEGTKQCALFALKNGVAMNIAGGTHHAHTTHGEGFCLLNDNALAAKFLLKNNLAKKVLIVDLDVHQGNGTAEIFKDDKSVFTFSMHGEKNYPMHKENSDLDIELPDGTDDKFYLKTLRNTLPKLLDEFEPDFIFYQCGVDIISSDKLGRLSCTIDGCKERDNIVLQSCKTNNIPIVASMGGGYSPNIKDIVEAHANTYRLAQEIYF
jgi:acetoin utilization deacetylase AcuC-like enzyme